MTLRKLVNELGVAHMTLCRYFVGREDLIREMLEQRQNFVAGSIAEKLGPMPDAIARLKGISDRYGTRFRMPEFAGCLFKHALAEFGDTWPEVTDVVMCYRNDLLTMTEALLKDVVLVNTACRLAGVYATRLTGVTADARTTGDPSAASQAWYAAEALLHQARAAMRAM